MMRDRGLESPSEVAASRQSIGALLGDLVGDSTALIRDEIELAKQELSEKISGLKPGILLIGIGAVIALASLLTLSAAAVIGLAMVMSLGLSAVIVGVALGLIALTILLIGVNRIRRLSLAPVQTIETLVEDKEWLKQLT